MKKLCSWITEHTGLVLVVFLILTVVCAALKPLIGVNYDMNDYLPPDSAALLFRNHRRGKTNRCLQRHP